MARIHESSTRQAAERVRYLGCKMRGYPRPDVNVGRGVHNVDLTTPPAPGAEKPGWTSFDVPIVPEWNVRPDPDAPLPPPDRWCVDCAAYEAELAIEDARPTRDKRLTTEERTECGARLAEVVERDAPERLRAQAARERVR